jgi:copper oxidase (laccase) domain-containing protein
MAKAMVGHLLATYATVKPENLKVLIGAGLRPCHFEVQSDVGGLFKEKYPDQMDERQGRTYVDLPAIVKYQLAQLDLLRDNIQDTRECNYDLPDRYFSFRRDHPSKPQSMVAFIALSNE